MAKPMPMLPPERDTMAVLMRRACRPYRRAHHPIARIDRRIGLDEGLESLLPTWLRAKPRRCRRHRLADTEGVSDG